MDALRGNQIPVCPKTQSFRDKVRCEVTFDGALPQKDRGQTMTTRRYAPIARDGQMGLQGFNDQNEMRDFTNANSESATELSGGLGMRILDAVMKDDFSPEEVEAVGKLLRAAGLETGESDLATDGRPRFRSNVRLLDPVVAADRAPPRVSGEQARGFFGRYPDARNVRVL